jgi:hypothetical protein
MKVYALACLVALTEGFVPNRLSRVHSTLHADVQEKSATATRSTPKVKELGLLTFDLDDTLYPIGPCVEAANSEFHSEILR